ncbi:MAG: Rhamnan synthesis, partial [Caulobacter sp.]|nr:Rhamnan synthesis [Caulobacter sp.]
MKPAFLGLTLGQEVSIDGTDADDRPILAAHGDDPQLIWTPDRAARTGLRNAHSVRVEVTLEAVASELVAPAVYVDWGDGFSEDSYARLKRNANGYFATLPARSRLLTRVRVDPSIAPCKFTVSDFVVTPVGTLGEDPRGWRGAAIQGVKRVLGPLRGPIGGLYR